MKRFVQFLLYFVIFCLIFYYVFNWKAFYSQFKYRYLRSYFKKSAEMANVGETKSVAGDFLIIPKIALKAPLVFSKSDSEEEIQKNLKNGVVLYPEESFLKQKGVAVITGHSSFGMTKGKYAAVFSLLDKLKKGDEFSVYFQNKEYKYRVSGSKIIGSEETDEVFKEKKEEGLVLLTCWPIGTTLKRLIVKAELIKK